MLQALYQLRHWFGWIIIGAIAAMLAYWGFTHTTQSRTIRLATAAEGGWYHEFGTILKEHVERQTNYRVELIETGGSVDNRRRLLAGDADLAILQVSAISMQNLWAVAPLWDDYVQIIVRRDGDINTLWDLQDRNVTIGGQGSGFRANALRVLDYYDIDPQRFGNNAAYFGTLLTDTTLDAAIVTTSLVNPDLRSLIASGDFEFLPLPGIAGFTFNHTYFRPGAIPDGVYTSPGMPRPAQLTPTITTDAILASNRQAPNAVIEAILPVIESLDLRSDAPALVQRDPTDDPIWRLLPVHPATIDYYTPYAGFGLLADLLSELAKFKELLLLVLLVIPAGIYQWKQQKRLRRENRLSALKQQLEAHFDEIFQIERAQREAKDIRLLQDHLNRLNYIKMKATKLSLGTPIGDSGLFLAFLQQTNSVSREIEWRLSMSRAPAPAGERS